MSENQLLKDYIIHLRKRFVTVGKLIFRSGLTSGSGGQISARIPSTDLIMVKPTNFCMGRLQPEDMVIIDMEGHVVEGRYKPTSETPFHLHVYKNRKDVNAIAHTHSPYATGFGVAGVALEPIWVEAMACVRGVPVVPYARGETRELGEAIIEYVKDGYAGLLQNHGVVALAPSLEEAYQTAKDVEWMAKIQFVASLVGKLTLMSKDEVEFWAKLVGPHPMAEITYPPRRL